MQPLNGTASFFQHKYNRDFTVFDAAPYLAADCKTALHTHRVEVFRYELHRLTAGVWGLVEDITPKVKSCTLRYDGHGIDFMGSATFEIDDYNNTINWLTDKIRVFHMLQMPDGHYVVWEKGTYHVPSPEQDLKPGAVRTVETQDTLRVYREDKITDWLKIPSPIPGGGFDDGDPVEWAKHFITFGYAGTGVSIPGTGIRVGDDPPPAPVRNRSKIYQVGTPKLDVINSLLMYINYDILRADVDGSLISQPFIKPSLRPLEYTFVADGSSIIVRESGVTKQDLWEAPNQWLRVVTRPDAPLLRSRLTLTDPLNPLSTTFRGRTVTDYAPIDAPDQATLDTVVQALYEDGQRVLKSLKMETPLMPFSHHDKVMVQWTSNHPWAPVSNGIYTVYGWTFPCVPGGKMQVSLELVPFSPAVAVPPGNSPYIFGGLGYYVNGVFQTVGINVHVADSGTGGEVAGAFVFRTTSDSGVGSESTVVTLTQMHVLVSDSGAGATSVFGPPVTIPSGVIVGWPGTHAGIPSGWTRETSMDARFAKQIPNSSTDPGVNAGNATHDHPFEQHSTHTWNHNHVGSWGTSLGGTGNVGGVASGGPVDTAAQNHTHPSSSDIKAVTLANNSAINTNTAVQDPLHVTIIFIRSNGTPQGIPVNSIVLYNGPVPAAEYGFSAYAALNNKYMKGAATAADGGAAAGTDTTAHTHTVPNHLHAINGHFHVTHLEGPPSLVFDWVSGANPRSDHIHNHLLGNSTTNGADNTDNATETTGAGDNTPASHKLRMIQKTGTAGQAPNMIAMWVDALTSIPSGWRLCDGTNGTPHLCQGKYIRGAASDGEVGDLSGGLTHIHAAGAAHLHGVTATHVHTFTGDSAQDGAASSSGSGVDNPSSSLHIHPSATFTSTTVSLGNSSSNATAQQANSSNDPVHRTVAYIMLA